TEDFAGVLAQQRRASTHRRPLAIEQREAAGKREGRAVDRDVLPESARAQLLVVVDVARVRDGIAEHVARDHTLEELALVQGREERAHLALERIDVRLRERAVVER